jgi:hypothetical protein
MKKSIFIFIAIIGMAIKANSQAITVSKDSLFIHGGNAASQGESPDIYDSYIFKNINATSDTFRWKRTVNDLPSSSWTTAVCDINICHDVLVDSAEFVMSKGDSGIFYSHFYPSTGSGTAVMVVEIFNTKDPSEKVVVYSAATAWDIFASVSTSKKETFFVWPNPNTQGFINIYSPEGGRLILKNIQGKVLFEGAISVGNQQIQTELFPTGVYLMELQTSKALLTQKLILN